MNHFEASGIKPVVELSLAKPGNDPEVNLCHCGMQNFNFRHACPLNLKLPIALETAARILWELARKVVIHVPAKQRLPIIQ